MDFYDRFVELCACKGVSPSKAATEAGLSKPTVTGWKNRNSNPTDLSLRKLSLYFGLTMEELLSEQKEKPQANAGDEISEEKQRIIDEITGRIAGFSKEQLMALRILLKGE